MRRETENMATERLEKVKAEGETRLFVLKPELKEQKKEKQEIMVGARDIGPARVLLPVIKELSRRGYPVSILTDRPSENFLIDSLGNRAVEIKTKNFILDALPQREPSLIISGLSGTANPGIEYYLESTGHIENNSEDKNIKNVPSILIEDYWGVATRKTQIDRKVWPDYICAFDEHSKKIDEENFKKRGIDFPSDRIIVTGSPSFDELASEMDIKEITERVRRDLEISEEENFVVYVGDTPPIDLDNLGCLIENMNKVASNNKKVVFTARIHPAIFADGPLKKYKKDYEDLLNKFTAGRVVETMGRFSTDEVAKAGDVIISTFSTEGIKAVYRGKTAVFMLLPDLGAKSLKDAVDMNTLPVIESGASIGIFSEKNMESSLKEALDLGRQEILRQAQNKNHRLDGRNTMRVVDLAEKILKEDKK